MLIAPAIYPEARSSRLRPQAFEGPNACEGPSSCLSPTNPGRGPNACADGGAQLEAFLGHWRAHLRPAHGLAFSQLNGAPLTAQGVHKLFYSSAFRITGKKTNPHLVRDMVVTYLRCDAFPARAPARRVGLGFQGFYSVPLFWGFRDFRPGTQGLATPVMPCRFPRGTATHPGHGGLFRTRRAHCRALHSSKALCVSASWKVFVKSHCAALERARPAAASLRCRRAPIRAKLC